MIYPQITNFLGIPFRAPQINKFASKETLFSELDLHWFSSNISLPM
jgi:hypothetical protein